MFYLNFLLYTLVRVSIKKFNYENRFNIICYVRMKNNFAIKSKRKFKKNIYIIPNICYEKNVDNYLIYCYSFLSGKLANI